MQPASPTAPSGAAPTPAGPASPATSFSAHQAAVDAGTDGHRLALFTAISLLGTLQLRALLLPQELACMLTADATLAAVLAWALLAPRSYRLYRSTAVAALRLTFAARMLLVDSTRLFANTAQGAGLPPLAESAHFLFTLAVASGVLLLDQVGDV
jgi:hypothetical protein